MLKIRVKRITDDEVEITILPKERDYVPPSPTTAESADAAPEPLPACSPERIAADKLKTFLVENGKWSASGCQEFLRGQGLSVDGLNFSRVRKMADVGHYQEGGRSWWFLISPIRAAAAELKKFLADGEHLESECREHLFVSGFKFSDERDRSFVLKLAGAVATEKDGLDWWSLSDDGTVEIAESFDGFSFDGLELIEETTWQTS